jgi:toxin ParE1/3/4
MKRFRIAPAARDDLKQISHYIAVEKQSPQGAKRLRARFLENFRRLARSPFIGQACPEFGPKMRIWPVGNYVVLYQSQSNGIDIIQVAHGAQNLPMNIRKPSGDV